MLLRIPLSENQTIRKKRKKSFNSIKYSLPEERNKGKQQTHIGLQKMTQFQKKTFSANFAFIQKPLILILNLGGVF
jgi:hypothetical protein